MDSAAEGTRTDAREYEQLHVRELIFLLTEKCNLNCVYCYEKRKNCGGVSLPAAFVKDKIREQMVATNGCKDLWIDFFGGEPLIEFDTIREVVDWFLATRWTPPAKKFRFLVETNGTLLDDRMKEWFADRREHVIVGLSLDGTKAAHDRNRSNSYDLIAPHFEFIRRNWPEQPVKMTIGPETLDQMYAGVLHIHSLGLQAEFDVIFEDVWGDGEGERRAVKAWAQQLDKLVDFYSAHPKLRRPDVLSRKLEYLFAPPPAKRTFCGAGKYMTSFTADGREWPCFRFAPIVVDQPLTDVFAAMDGENAECRSCPFEKICTTCEGHNYAVTGSCFNRTSFHCRFFKVSLLASARMRLLDRPCGQPPENQTKEERLEEMRSLLAIRVINDVCSPLLEWASAREE